MQAGAYQNSTWVVGAAKCGTEEGSNMIGQSAIIAPSGEIVAQARDARRTRWSPRAATSTSASAIGETIFNFAKHREPEHYRLIVERNGAIPPPA